jgi:hypothetical protein
MNEKIVKTSEIILNLETDLLSELWHLKIQCKNPRVFNNIVFAYLDILEITYRGTEDMLSCIGITIAKLRIALMDDSENFPSVDEVINNAMNEYGIPIDYLETKTAYNRIVMQVAKILNVKLIEE